MAKVTRLMMATKEGKEVESGQERNQGGRPPALDWAGGSS